jgi:hypothetical protein
MTGMSIDPRAAADEIARVSRQVHRSRWWHVAAALVMAVFLAAFYTLTTAYPEASSAYAIVALIVCSAMLAFIGWRRRAVDREARKLEEPAIWASLALAGLTIVLKFFLEPEGLTPLVVVMGLLPALPFLALAWRIARR